MNKDQLHVHQVKASHGWAWIAKGFALFRMNPVMWILMFAIYLLIAMVLSYINLVGPLVLNLLAPVFVGGFMFGCRALDNGEQLELNHLFAGFKQHTGQLITVGGIYMTGILLVMSVMFFSIGPDAMHALTSGNELTSKQAEAILGHGFYKTLLIGLLLIVPLVMSYWFAPTLIIFNELTAAQAMRQSFLACVENILPFMVYGLITMVLLMLAIIPLGLGLLLMIPVMTASIYTSYSDIFEDAPVKSD